MKRERHLFENTAEVVAGAKKIKFMIHTDLTSERSKFFKYACSPAWRGDKKPIDLPDTDPGTFSDYLQLLYRGKIVHHSDIQETFLKLIRLYKLADFLDDLQSANEIIDNFIKYSDQQVEFPDHRCISLTWESHPENSPLRRLMVDYYVHEIWNTARFDTDMDNHSPAFLKAVTKEFVRFRWMKHSSTHASERSTCYYHQHDDFCPQCEDDEAEEEDDK